MLLDARKAVRLSNWLGTGLLSLVFLIGAGLVGIIPAGITFILTGSPLAPSSPIGSAIYQAALNIFSFSPIFLLIWIWVRLYEKRPFSLLGLHPMEAGKKYLRGFLFGMLMFSISVVILWVVGSLHPGPALPASTGLAAIPAVVIMLVGWLVQGPGEEILCRGWMMPVLGACYNVTVGVLVSSAIFGLYHTLNPSFSVIALLNIFLVGIFLCLFTLGDAAVWGVFGWHSAWNWAQGNLFGLSVSGLDVSGGSLLRFQLQGPTFLTGGGFGPEGGLAVTAVLVLGVCAAWIWLRRRSTQKPPNIPV
jgi:uncharacterized protein